MKKTLIKVAIGILFILAFLICFQLEDVLYRRFQRVILDPDEYTTAPETSQTQPASILLDFEVLTNRENELVFNRTLDEFINSYNSFYYGDKQKSCLSPKSVWKSSVLASGIHSTHKTLLFEFTEDKEMWSYPTICAYVPANSDFIQEIAINFDVHGYSEPLYHIYEGLCFYTLSVFFPELSSQQITDLYTQLNVHANQNIFDKQNGYKPGCVPCVLYHKNGIGVYPYLADGEWQHLCIIPVTEETLQNFSAKGTEIYEIE